MRNRLLLLIAIFCIMLGAPGLTIASTFPTAGAPVDIARFAREVTWTGPTVHYTAGSVRKSKMLKPERGILTVIAAPGENTLNFGLAWDEPRMPRTITIMYADPSDAPSLGNRELPALPKPENARIELGTSPWQSEWHALKPSEGFSLNVSGRKWTYHLPKLQQSIYQLRIALSDTSEVRIESITAEVDAKWREAQFRVSYDSTLEKFISIEGFNATVIKTEPVAGQSAVDVIALASDAPSESEDRAIFTVRAGEKSFSFLMNDLDADGTICVKTLGGTVTKHNAQVATPAGKTIIERVLDMPEQTFDNALNNIPVKARNKFLVLCPPLNYSKFAIKPNGDIFGRDDEDINYCVATGDKPDYNRCEPQHVEGGYLPVLYADWQDQGLNWQQGYVVTAVEGKFDDPSARTMMVTKVSATNPGKTPVAAKLWLCLADEDKKCVGVQLKDGAIIVGDRLRGVLAAGEWAVDSSDGPLLLTVTVPPGESRSVELDIPHGKLKTTLAMIGFDAARKESIDYWNSKLAGGCDIKVPDERINALWKSLLIHQYTWGDYKPEKGYAVANVAAFLYGPVGNESSQIAKALDYFGHAKMAGDYFDPMWEIQGSSDLPAMTTNGDGCMPGWWNGYVFNTGFELWNICNHYRLTGDRTWFDRAIPNMIKACDWIIEQRKTTIGWDPDGRPAIESGFFPRCGLEDEGGFFFWVMTNGYLYCGVKSMADILTEIGHPDAPRLRREAAAYLRDIQRDVAEATVRCPVMKLRDGSYVPYIPKHLQRRGRVEGFYEAELGSLHLLTTGVYGPREPQVDWTLNFLEDAVFMTEAPSHDSIISYANLEKDWFDLGGYGKAQPYLVHQQIAYLRRDQPKLFLRSFWNQLVAQAFLDINAFPEHIIWKGAADCKTYEEAMWLQQFRSMLVFDEDNELRLCTATPREWLAQGKTISVKKAPTFFGPISYDVISDVDNGKITARVEFSPRKTPSKLTIRFRHPKQLKIKSVTINGKAWQSFNAEKETIDLPVDGKPLEVVVRY